MPPSPYTNPVNPWSGDLVSAEAKGNEVWYRAFDNVDAKQMGGWVTPVRPSTSSDAIKDLNLPNNQATLVTEVRPPAGTRFQIGQATGGGGTQIHLLDKVPASNWGPIQPLPKALLPAPKTNVE